MGLSPLNLNILPTPIPDIKTAEMKIHELINRLDFLLRYLKQDTVKNEIDISALADVVAGLSGGGLVLPTEYVTIGSDYNDYDVAYELTSADSGKMIIANEGEAGNRYVKLPAEPTSDMIFWFMAAYSGDMYVFMPLDETNIKCLKTTGIPVFSNAVSDSGRDGRCQANNMRCLYYQDRSADILVVGSTSVTGIWTGVLNQLT